jgi:Peptidase M1 N-terminal domain
MRRLALLCVVLSSSLSFAQRLPELARSVNYKLTFAPDFEKNIFAGQETISVQILKPTSEIVLNVAEIDFLSASITSAPRKEER